MSKWTEADLQRATNKAATRPVVNAQASAGTSVSSAPAASPEQPVSNRRTSTKIADDRKAPRLRAACELASYPGYDGLRIVACGLTPDQARHLLAAARAAGIAVAADAEDTLSDS